MQLSKDNHFLFINDIKVMLYFTLSIIAIPLLIKFKTVSKVKKERSNIE